MSNVIVSKTHEDWLKSRSGGIGSSEVGTLLGLNPYESPYELWLYKTGRVESVEQENFFMKAGHYLEDAVSRFYADETGVDIVKSSAAEFVVVDKDKPFMRVSPDRYAYIPNAKRNNDNKMIIECKTTQMSIDEADVPKTWFCQLMYQLSVCKLDRGALAWLTQGREFGYKNINYDPEFGGWLREEVERFWVDNILGDQEPALTSVRDVLLKYPKHRDGLEMTATQELVDKWKELTEANAEIKRLTAIKDAAENAIKLAMGEAEGMVSPDNGKTLATWRGGKDMESFDKERFIAENPELYKSYIITKPSPRRFLIKK